MSGGAPVLWGLMLAALIVGPCSSIAVAIDGGGGQGVECVSLAEGGVGTCVPSPVPTASATETSLVATASPTPTPTEMWPSPSPTCTCNRPSAYPEGRATSSHELVAGGEMVTLTAELGGSSDASSVYWTQLAGPPVELMVLDELRASFVAPHVPEGSILRFSLDYCGLAAGFMVPPHIVCLTDWIDVIVEECEFAQPGAEVGFEFELKPPRPFVGDQAELTVSMFTTNGGLFGLPQYTLSGTDPQFSGDVAPRQFSQGPSDQVYMLEAVAPGSTQIRMAANFETALGCQDSPVFQFRNTTSDPFSVDVSCPGDCGADDVVSIDELIRAVDIALGNQQVTRCLNADLDSDGRVSIAELIRAVTAALSVCR